MILTERFWNCVSLASMKILGIWVDKPIFRLYWWFQNGFLPYSTAQQPKSFRCRFHDGSLSSATVFFVSSSHNVRGEKTGVVSEVACVGSSASDKFRKHSPNLNFPKSRISVEYGIIIGLVEGVSVVKRENGLQERFFCNKLSRSMYSDVYLEKNIGFIHNVYNKCL